MNGNNRSLICVIRGPVTLITVGVLFALNNFTPYGFSQTWPVLLIVFGLLSLLRRGTERQAASSMPASDSPAFQPYAYPPPASSTGSYRQTPYAPYTPPPPAGPSKGGFGTSAPPKPGEPPQTPPPGDSI